MIEVPVLDINGEEKEKLQVDEAAFGGKVRLKLLREAVIMYEANQRIGTASTKTRGEVSGSGRKPYRQKGTGYARAGSRRSPIWRGGGITFGPKPRDYSYRLPRKALKLALKSAILGKLLDNEVTLVDELKLEQPKTKLMAKILESLGLRENTCLIVSDADGEALWRAARNIPGVSVKPWRELNAYDVVRVERLLMTKETMQKLMGTSEK